MPVVALPESNTDRWILDYTINEVPHHMQMRTGSTKTESQVSTTFDGFLTTLASDLNELVVVSLRHAVEGSDVFNPATWSGAASYGAGNTNDSIGRVLTLSFTGRDTSGHKIKLFVFGTKNLSEGDYRVDPTESAVVESALDYLAAAAGYWLTINALQPTWNQYANQNLSQHWVKALR